MNTQLSINDLGNWLISSGILYVIYQVVSPLLHQLISTQKATKARATEETILTSTDKAVAAAAIYYGATGPVKKQMAVDKAKQDLKAHDISVDDSRLNDAVEYSVQKFYQSDAPAVKKQAEINASSTQQTGGPVAPVKAEQ